VPYLENEDFSYQNPYIVENEIEKSIAIYSYFDSPDDIDIVTFELKPEDFLTEDGKFKERSLFVQLLVPACPTYEDEMPELLVTRQLKNHLLHESAFVTLLPDELNLRYQEIVMKYDFNQEKRKVWHEQYSNRYYFMQEGEVKALNTPGKYTIHIWNKSKRPSDYVFALGSIDNFDQSDWDQANRLLPIIIPRKELNNQNCVQELQERYPKS
jgi:hypothetical protein